jgi:hypothetical protein
MGHFRLGCDSPPLRFLRTRSCKSCPSKGTGREDASLQELLGLQRWPRHRLGGCSHTRTGDWGQRESADHPIGLFRLLYRLGVDDDCSIRLSAAKALGVKPQPGVISSAEAAMALQEFARVLQPGGILLLAFHGGQGEIHSSEWFGRPVAIDVTLFEGEEMDQSDCRCAQDDISSAGCHPFASLRAVVFARALDLRLPSQRSKARAQDDIIPGCHPERGLWRCASERRMVLRYISNKSGKSIRRATGKTRNRGDREDEMTCSSS